MKKPYLLIQYFILLLITTSFSTDDNHINNLPDTAILLKKVTKTFNTGATYQTIYFTYIKNKLQTITYFDANNVLSLTGSFTYENNIFTKFEQFNENNELINFSIPEYNTNNQLINYIKYDETTILAKKHLFTYNSNNEITKTIYQGDYNSQNEFIDELTYEIDIHKNITKIIAENYSIDYSYDQKNGISKNLAAKKTLNLMGLLYNISPLDRGVLNNALSFEYNNATITDHQDCIVTYNDDNFPIYLIYNSPTFGEGFHLQFEYE